MSLIKKAAFAIAAIGAASALLCGSALAADTEYGRIAYFDVNGNPMTSFVSGDTVVAKIKTRSAGPKKMTFMLLLYDDDKLTACGLDSKQADGGVTEYSASITIPAEVGKPELNAVMWDSLAEMNPICASSNFGSADTDMIALYINGSAIEDFNPEVTDYSVKIATDTIKLPLITAKTGDNGAKIEVTNPESFPGKSTVRVIAQNGTASDKVYTINYECDQKLVDNIDFPNEAVKAQYNGKYTYFPAVEKGFAPYCDRGAVTVISDEIIGKPYIQGSIGQYSSNETKIKEITDCWNDSDAIWFTFDLNRPATVETYSEKPLSKSRWKDIGERFSLEGSNPYYGWGWTCKYKYSVKADVGRFEVPTLCTDSGMLLTFVFDGYTEPADVNELDF